MMLPFTAEHLLGVPERYNRMVWPLQTVAYLLGLAAVGLAILFAALGTALLVWRDSARTAQGGGWRRRLA